MKLHLGRRNGAIAFERPTEIAPAVLNKSIEDKDSCSKSYLKSLGECLSHSWLNLNATLTHNTA